MRRDVINGDMRIAVPMLEPVFDACVTDPPYELGFMGKAWDKSGVSFQVGTWRAVYEALKPGAHLLAFGGTRTVHRIACAIEDAGFEIRDQIQWLYGSGFPKSLDVSKAIDKAAGAERAGTGEVVRAGCRAARGGGELVGSGTVEDLKWKEITVPATPEAQHWQGWGTALKPACEPIIVARKPLSEPNVAANALTHGTGAINIDACRIATTEQWEPSTHQASESIGTFKTKVRTVEQHPSGRWPANVILGCACEIEHEEGCALRILDEQSGERKAGGDIKRGSHYARMGFGFGGESTEREHSSYSDSGGASRFYYCAKATKDERAGGNHPTVKPLSLKRYLVRLVTPKGGRVLDPFAGTFKTGEACAIESFEFTGIDIDPANCETGRARIARASGIPATLPQVNVKRREEPLFA